MIHPRLPNEPDVTQLEPINHDDFGYNRVRGKLAKRPGSETMNERWVSVAEIAEHLGVSKDTVYTWIETKRMPAHRVGRLWKFQRAEVDDWVKSGGAASDGPANAGKGRR